MQQLMNLTQFNEKVKTTGTAVVKIGSVTCPPCRKLEPIVDELAQQFKDVPFYKVDTDNSPDIVDELAIMSIPVVLTYNNGSCVKTFVGYQDKKTLTEAIKGWA